MKWHLISTVLRYEANILRRSWVFRVFAFLVLIGITFVQFLSQGAWILPEHYMVGLPASIPLFNAYWFNIVQSLVLVFIVGDYYRAEKHVDTLETLRVRPVSNAVYLGGKAIGILLVFFVFNLLSLFFSLLLHVLAIDTPVAIFPYFFYLFTLTLPTCIFVLGLVLFIHYLVKNSLLALFVSLGFVGFIFYFLSANVFGIFDFFAREIPNMFSEMVGHVDLWPYLLHRLAYLILGIGFVVWSIFLIPHLTSVSQKRKMKLTGSLCMVVGLVLGGSYVYCKSVDNRFRARLVEAYNQTATMGKAWLSSEDIVFEQTGKRMQATARLVLENRQDYELKEILLYLNPMLKIKRILHNGQNLPFRRNLQTIVLEKNLQPDEKLDIDMIYEGGIDGRIAYLDISDKEYNDPRWVTGVFCYGKKYVFLNDRFTLLDPEIIWYPVTVPPVVPETPFATERNLTDYTLKVIRKDDRTVLSQGKTSVRGDTICFENKDKLSGINLCMGDYERRSITIDSIDLELYLFHGQDIFIEPYMNLSDTLFQTLTEFKHMIDRDFGKYPYEKFVVLETPVSYASYFRGWSGKSNYVQPEMVFVPERGVTMANWDHLGMKKMVRLAKTRKNMIGFQKFPPSREFFTYLDNVFRSKGILFYPLDFSMLERKVDDLGMHDGVGVVNKHCISSLFNDHKVCITSESVSIASQIFNVLSRLKASADRERYKYAAGGMRDFETALYLSEHSLEEAVSDPTVDPDRFNYILFSKCLYLREMITLSVPLEKWNDFMDDFVHRYQYQSVKFEDFFTELKNELDFDVAALFTEWYSSSGASALYLKDVQVNPVETGDFKGYKVSFRLCNLGNKDIITDFGVGSDFMSGAAFERNERTVLVKAGEGYEMKIVCKEKPGMVNVFSHLALNAPSESVFFLQESNYREATRDSSQGLSLVPKDYFFNPDEIIVDDLDEGFSLVDANGKEVTEEPKKVIEPRQHATRWVSTVSGVAYGKTIRRFCYKNIGDGKAKAIWKARLPKSGRYEVFIFNVNGGGVTISVGGGRPQNYVLYHKEGKEEIALSGNLSSWISVGVFAFDEGEAKMELSDKMQERGGAVYADAIKWVYVGEE